MPYFNRLRLPLAALLAGLMIALAGPAPAAHAQTHLVSAIPGPDSTISLPPDEVRLVFDHPLLAEGTSLHVVDQNQVPVEKGSGHIDPANPFALVASLPVLFEGQYTVSYTAATVGSSTILEGTYTFTLNLPEPVLSLTFPTNGEAFQPGPVPIRLETRFIDFNVYESRVRLYVDGHLYREWPGLRASVDGLLPGVHEIRTVLVQVGQEVPDTSTTVYVAITRPDAFAVAAIPEAFEPQTLSLSSIHLGELAILVVVLLGLGLWLGRHNL